MDSIQLADYVSVQNAIVGTPGAWGDNFESFGFPSNGITLDNPDGGITWERTTDAADEGTASVRIQNLVNTNYGQADALLLPPIDFTQFTAPTRMYFRWAYARRDPSYSDELLVLVSKDCGSTWTQKFYRTGTSLATGPTQSTLFVPTATQWKLANIDLSTYAAENHVDVKIVNVTDGGNALYIDSLTVGPFDFTLEKAERLNSGKSMIVFPSPATDQLTVRLPEGNPIRSIAISDVLGRELIRLKYGLSESNSIDIRHLPKGLYHLNITSFGSYYTTFIKE